MHTSKGSGSKGTGVFMPAWLGEKLVKAKERKGNRGDKGRSRQQSSRQHAGAQSATGEASDGGEVRPSAETSADAVQNSSLQQTGLQDKSSCNAAASISALDTAPDPESHYALPQPVASSSADQSGNTTAHATAATPPTTSTPEPPAATTTAALPPDAPQSSPLPEQATLSAQQLQAIQQKHSRDVRLQQALRSGSSFSSVERSAGSFSSRRQPPALPKLPRNSMDSSTKLQRSSIESSSSSTAAWNSSSLPAKPVPIMPGSQTPSSSMYGSSMYSSSVYSSSAFGSTPCFSRGGSGLTQTTISRTSTLSSRLSHDFPELSGSYKWPDGCPASMRSSNSFSSLHTGSVPQTTPRCPSDVTTVCSSAAAGTILEDHDVEQHQTQLQQQQPRRLRPLHRLSSDDSRAMSDLQQQQQQQQQQMAQTSFPSSSPSRGLGVSAAFRNNIDVPGRSLHALPSLREEHSTHSLYTGVVRSSDSDSGDLRPASSASARCVYQDLHEQESSSGVGSARSSSSLARPPARSFGSVGPSQPQGVRQQLEGQQQQQRAAASPVDCVVAPVLDAQQGTLSRPFKGSASAAGSAATAAAAAAGSAQTAAAAKVAAKVAEEARLVGGDLADLQVQLQAVQALQASLAVQQQSKAVQHTGQLQAVHAVHAVQPQESAVQLSPQEQAIHAGTAHAVQLQRQPQAIWQEQLQLAHALQQLQGAIYQQQLQVVQPPEPLQETQQLQGTMYRQQLQAVQAVQSPEPLQETQQVQDDRYDDYADFVIDDEIFCLSRDVSANDPQGFGLQAGSPGGPGSSASIQQHAQRSGGQQAVQQHSLQQLLERLAIARRPSSSAGAQGGSSDALSNSVLLAKSPLGVGSMHGSGNAHRTSSGSFTQQQQQLFLQSHLQQQAIMQPPVQQQQQQQLLQQSTDSTRQPLVGGSNSSVYNGHSPSAGSLTTTGIGQSFTGSSHSLTGAGQSLTSGMQYAQCTPADSYSVPMQGNIGSDQLLHVVNNSISCDVPFGAYQQPPPMQQLQQLQLQQHGVSPVDSDVLTLEYILQMQQPQMARGVIAGGSSSTHIAAGCSPELPNAILQMQQNMTTSDIAGGSAGSHAAAGFSSGLPNAAAAGQPATVAAAAATWQNPSGAGGSNSAVLQKHNTPAMPGGSVGAAVAAIWHDSSRAHSSNPAVLQNLNSPARHAGAVGADLAQPQPQALAAQQQVQEKLQQLLHVQQMQAEFQKDLMKLLPLV